MEVLYFIHTYKEKNGISKHVECLCKEMPADIKIRIVAGSGKGLPFFSSLRMPAIELWQAFKSDFDIIHIHGYGNFYSFFGALLSFAKGKPLVWTLHGYPKITGMRKIAYWIYRYLMAPIIFLRAHKIITVSEESIALLRKETDKEIVFLPNGVDLRMFAPRTPYSRAKFACFVGRLDADKGAERMLECRFMPILFAGPDEGKEKAKLEKMAKEKGIAAKFVEVPYYKMPSIYEKCRYVVLPSKYEGFPLTMLEALAMERPFISTDVGEVKRTIASLGLEEKDFILEGDVGEKLLELEKKNLENQLKLARRRLSRYSWGAVAKKLASIYRKCLQS